MNQIARPRVTLDPGKPMALLRACAVYRPSPLEAVELRNGQPLLVKDETDRMGLGAFKALGGIYAVAQLIAARIGVSIAPEALLSPEIRAVAQGMTTRQLRALVGKAIQTDFANDKVVNVQGMLLSQTEAVCMGLAAMAMKMN